jgi:hypothetical protein
MIRVASLLSLFVVLGALSGCSVGTDSSDEVIDTSDEQSLTHVTEGTDQKVAPAQQVRETLGFVSARSVQGPQPDPWQPVTDSSEPSQAGPQPDPWKGANHRVPPPGNGSVTTSDKH